MKLTSLFGAAAVTAMLALAACSGHGAGGVPCVETMPGMTMCPPTSSVAGPTPATVRAPQD
jgi:hypothetical protein